MKKVIAIIVLFFVGAMAVKCSKPRLTKEQQNNITTQIARNYDVKEIEFLYFGHDWVVGFYSVKIKINGDENKIHVMRYHDPKEFDNDRNVDVDFFNGCHDGFRNHVATYDTAEENE